MHKSTLTPDDCRELMCESPKGEKVFEKIREAADNGKISVEFELAELGYHMNCLLTHMGYQTSLSYGIYTVSWR